MGGVAPTGGGKGGKKDLDAQVNLVPYIDLLMTIMTFLVMTAVWTQLATLEVQNSSGGQAEEKDEKDENKPKPIFVIVTDRAVKVQEEGAEPKDFPNKADGYDIEGVEGELKALKEARPDRVEVQVKAEDGVVYSDITKVIDVCTGLELTGLTLQPASQ
jgi:biopolymer transport protein ExbD